MSSNTKSAPVASISPKTSAPESVAELEAKIAAMQAAVAERKAAAMSNARAGIDAILAEASTSLAHLYPELFKSKPRAPRAPRDPNAPPRAKRDPKYVHPQDASKHWTGQGKTPKWVSEWEAGGGTREQLLVKPAA